MENRKDIGKAISDKLNSLDKEPREQVWIGISEALQKKKKRRFGFFFFWTAMIGLPLIGAVTAWYIYQKSDADMAPNTNAIENTIVNGREAKTNNNDNSHDNAVADSDGIDAKNSSITADENSSENKSLNKHQKNSNRNVSGNKNSRKTSVGKNGKTNAKSSYASKKAKNNKKADAKAKNKKTGKKGKGKSGKANNDLTTDQLASLQGAKKEIDLTTLQGSNTEGKLKEVNAKKTDSLAAKKEKEKKKKTSEKTEDKTVEDSSKGFHKFHVDAFVSPTHYGYSSNKSTLDDRLNSNKKSTELEWNYGVGLSYELTDKVMIRSGYSRAKLNYTTHDALVDTPNYNNIKYKTGIDNQSIFTASGGDTTMDITQKITYSEIPLEVRYKFLDKKIRLHGIGGFSFLMLNDNTVHIKTLNGFSQNIGRTNGILDISLSFNIGIGLDYQIFKNTKLFVEPMFNYQATSFEDKSHKPYFFGLHTGIRYALINK